MSTAPNYAVANNLATALNAGMSESTVESQHVKAIAVLTGRNAVDSTESTALANALALLNLQLAHIRAPGTKGGA